MIETFIGAFSALFSVVNPLGGMPVFMMLSADSTIKEKRRQALKVAVYMIAILSVFFLAGNFILDFFGIELDHVRIAGGILICISAFSLLGKDAFKGKTISKEVQQEGLEKEDFTFTPMAMPLLSGPGSIALMISMYSEASNGGIIGMAGILLAVILVAALTYIVLVFSSALSKFLGKGGMAALSKMMGFISLSIGVSLIIGALERLFGS